MLQNKYHPASRWVKIQKDSPSVKWANLAGFFEAGPSDNIIKSKMYCMFCMCVGVVKISIKVLPHSIWFSFRSMTHAINFSSNVFHAIADTTSDLGGTSEPSELNLASSDASAGISYVSPPHLKLIIVDAVIRLRRKGATDTFT